ncbi:MAG: hypothetical protein KAI47_09660 [Deltaproteobacteria bacterium]|nr:hypothetical protein [Deltaproteobacteria bacterium]
MRSSRRSLDLNVDPASILRPGTSRSASPSSAPPKTDTRTQAQRLKARLDTSLARERALRNVAVGRVPPLLYGVERDAKKMFRPTWTLSENDASKVGTMGDTTKRLLRALGRSYLKALRKYATGNPDSVREESKRTKMLDGYASVMRVTTKSAAGFSCDVCADIVGTLRAARNVTLHLKQSSKRPRFDRLAISALKKALRIRTGVARLNAPKHPEKRELTATSRPAKRHRLRACYRFIAKYYRVPPIPMVGCQFDEVKLTLRCYYPGKKILNADVSLLSVEKRSDPS